MLSATLRGRDRGRACIAGLSEQPGKSDTRLERLNALHSPSPSPHEKPPKKRRSGQAEQQLVQTVVPVQVVGKEKKRTKAAAQAKAPAKKPPAIPSYRPSTSRSSAGTLSPEPGTYGSGGACSATGHISVIDDPPSTRPRHAVRNAVIDRRHRRRRSEQRPTVFAAPGGVKCCTRRRGAGRDTSWTLRFRSWRALFPANSTHVLMIYGSQSGPLQRCGPPRSRSADPGGDGHRGRSRRPARLVGQRTAGMARVACAARTARQRWIRAS